MTPELLYAITTLAGWIGVFWVLRVALLGLRLAMKAPGVDVARTRTGMLLSGGWALGLLMVASLVPNDVGREVVGTGFRVPVVWFYSPFWGWVVAAGIFFLGASLIQASVSISAAERRAKLIQGGIWLGVLLVGALLFRQTGANVTTFRGAFYLSWFTVAVLVLLALGTLAFMVFTSKRSTTRSFSKTFFTHLTLIAGCVIFGLPFAWLLTSSFKEDKDMTGEIVWIPRVTSTVPFLDPKDLRYAKVLEGTEVTAAKIEDLPNGLTRFDILTPLNRRGQTFEANMSEVKQVPRDAIVVTGSVDGQAFRGFVAEELATGERIVKFLTPESLKDQTRTFKREEVTEERPTGLRTKNYTEALQFLPPETNYGLVYLRNTLFLVVMNVIGTILSCAIVAYAFSRLSFPGKDVLFKVMLATMMLPGAVTLLPQFLIFKQLGWIDTLQPLWVPAFFASAFNVFMLRQFFEQIPMELEDAAKVDGCTYLHTFWTIMLPQVKPALAVIAIWTFMGTWNNFMGPLIYINSPENMPIAYALQLFNGERGGEPGMLMAFANMSIIPVLLLFFFAQKYFIEGVTLSGLGGR